jgi:hypothetical protein
MASEIYEAFKLIERTGAFDRNVFRTRCPRSESSGRCGFVIVGRILEALDVAIYAGREQGFVKPPPS